MIGYLLYKSNYDLYKEEKYDEESNELIETRIKTDRYYRYKLKKYLYQLKKFFSKFCFCNNDNDI